MLLVNLALSDLGISMVGNPPAFLAALDHGWTFPRPVCVIYGFLMSLFGIESITTLTALSFERFLMIARPWETSGLTHRGALLLTGLTWLYATLTTCPPLLGWGGFRVEGPGISCSVDWETRSWHNTSYIVFLFFLGLGLPVAVMLFSYASILASLKKHGATGLQVGVARAERRVAAMVMVMVLTFLVAWTPYAVMSLLMAFGDPALVTPAAAAVPAIFAKSSCIYNPIIYVGLNTQFRSAWSRLLRCREAGPSGGSQGEKISFTVFTEHSPQNMQQRRIGRSTRISTLGEMTVALPRSNNGDTLAVPHPTHLSPSHLAFEVKPRQSICSIQGSVSSFQISAGSFQETHSEVLKYSQDPSGSYQEDMVTSEYPQDPDHESLKIPTCSQIPLEVSGKLQENMASILEPVRGSQGAPGRSDAAEVTDLDVTTETAAVGSIASPTASCAGHILVPALSPSLGLKPVPAGSPTLEYLVVPTLHSIVGPIIGPALNSGVAPRMSPGSDPVMSPSECVVTLQEGVMVTYTYNKSQHDASSQLL